MLKVNVTEQDSAAIINIEGEVDLYSSRQVREALLKLTEAKSNLIVVDLKAVGYMDSSGLATLIEGLQKSAEYGGKFRICQLQQGVKDVFELSNLDQVFEIHETLETALTV